jgi:hypothetical protein
MSVKKLTIVFAFFVFLFELFIPSVGAQTPPPLDKNGNVISSPIASAEKKEGEYGTVVTFGVLEGGGGIVGADIELALIKSLGVQGGIGWSGKSLTWDCGLNIHFKPTIKSSFVSLQYSRVGYYDFHLYSCAGPVFVFRGKRWFTAQVGVARFIEKGPYWGPGGTPEFVLNFAVGAYFAQ